MEVSCIYNLLSLVLLASLYGSVVSNSPGLRLMILNGGIFFPDPRPSGQFNKNRENGRKPALDNQVLERRKLPTSHETAITTREVKIQQTKKNEAPVRMNKPLAADSGPGRPPKSNMQRKSNVELKMQQKVENNSIQRRPPIDKLEVRKTLFVHQLCIGLILSDLNFFSTRNPLVQMMLPFK